jgi:predicted nucleic acid-binding protein
VNVLVDTSVWSRALRRAARVDDAVVQELAELIREGRVTMMGPIRQELLSGIKVRSQFERLREHLRGFPDLDLGSADYEQAAECFNRCRERGLQGSNTDFLICAVAARHRLAVFTRDDDFQRFAHVLPIELYAPRR